MCHSIHFFSTSLYTYTLSALKCIQQVDYVIWCKSINAFTWPFRANFSFQKIMCQGAKSTYLRVAVERKLSFSQWKLLTVISVYSHGNSSSFAIVSRDFYSVWDAISSCDAVCSWDNTQQRSIQELEKFPCNLFFKF